MKTERMNGSAFFQTLEEAMEALPDEQAAVDKFTAIRWRNGAFCPYCGGARIYHFADHRTHKCAECRKRFSIKVGTVFEGSKLGLREWMLAVWLMRLEPEKLSSTVLARRIGVTQKTAWNMLHRMRHVKWSPHLGHFG